MNNVIILGKVISKSVIHFDYLDKLKVYFKMEVREYDNVFSVIVSEKYLGIYLINDLYSNVCVGDIVCVYGSLILEDNRYLILCSDIVTLK